MAGYDLELLELMLRSDVNVTFVGDHRQATFATNRGKKNKAFSGPAIIKKFKAWENAGLVSINYEQHTYRCNQAIADLGDSFFPDEPRTLSRNDKVTGHDGIFLVFSSDVEEYVRQFDPQLLRYSSTTKCGLHEASAMNFGQSKGLTFERVLIYPHEKGKSWLNSGKLIHVEKSAAKMYVAVTRARYSVAFVYDKETCAIPAARWVP